MRINHRRFQVLTRPPETSEETNIYPNVKTSNIQLWLFNHFRFSPTQYIPPEKTSSNSSSRRCESQGRSREEEKEKEGEEEEKDFISNSGQRPRHAVENNQNLSLSCHKKRESLAMFSQFLTPWADKSSGVKKPMSDTGRQIHHNTARERIHNTTPVSRSTHQHWFCLRAEVPQIQVEGRCASHRVSEASPPCLGWRRYASGHSHHPREF